MREITLSTTALANLIDLFPNPDDPEPTGPGGPVIRWLEWVGLNPQPLPPRWHELLQAVLMNPVPWRRGPSPEPWGPHPEPWLWAAVTRATISTHLNRLEAAGIIIVSGDLEHAIRSTGESLVAFVDDICGTPPRPRPFPPPWGPVLDPETLHPLNLIVAGAQFQKAADALGDHPLHDTFEESAERLLSTGIARLSES